MKNLKKYLLLSLLVFNFLVGCGQKNEQTLNVGENNSSKQTESLNKGKGGQKYRVNFVSGISFELGDKVLPIGSGEEFADYSVRGDVGSFRGSISEISSGLLFRREFQVESD